MGERGLAVGTGSGTTGATVAKTGIMATGSILAFLTFYSLNVIHL